MVKSSFDKHVEIYWTESWKSFVQCLKKITKVLFFRTKLRVIPATGGKAVLKTLQKNFCEKVDTFAPNVREKTKNFFRKKLHKLFLHAAESSFDHTVEVFLTKPEKFSLNVQNDLQTIFILRKKTYFLRKGSSGRGKCFWQNRKVSRSMSKIMSKTFFFKKKFFWWKNSSGHVQCSSDHPVKKLRQRAKKLALNVRKRPETV